jgi:transcriptional regulator with XRE-family HTH domain
MHFIPDNLRFLRRQKAWTQEQFAHYLGVKRSLIGAYEEGRADPRISFLLLICQKFDLSMDQLVSGPLEEGGGSEMKFTGSNLRILPITIDKSSNNETAALVPIQASAGYLNGYGDIEFIESLPIFDMPYSEVSKGKTYRVFQIKGESMLPILPNSYIIGSYVMDWNNIKNDGLYIIISKTEGIVFKRVLNKLKDQTLTLKSDNPEFETYSIDAQDVLEVWKAEGMTTFEFGIPSYDSQHQLLGELRAIKNEINALKWRFNT